LGALHVWRPPESLGKALPGNGSAKRQSLGFNLAFRLLAIYALFSSEITML